MKLYLSAGSVLAVAFALVVGSFPGSVDSGTSSVLGVPYSGPTQCSNCPNCFLSSTKHKAPSGGGTFAGLHDDCIEQMPCGHPYCGESAANSQKDPYSEEEYQELRNLVDRILDGEESALLTVLARFPEKARINRDRRALQVSACSEESLLSHIPLTSEFYSLAVEFTEQSELAE